MVTVIPGYSIKIPVPEGQKIEEFLSQLQAEFPDIKFLNWYRSNKVGVSYGMHSSGIFMFAMLGDPKDEVEKANKAMIEALSAFKRLVKYKPEMTGFAASTDGSNFESGYTKLACVVEGAVFLRDEFANMIEQRLRQCSTE